MRGRLERLWRTSELRGRRGKMDVVSASILTRFASGKDETDEFRVFLVTKERH